MSKGELLPTRDLVVVLPDVFYHAANLNRRRMDQLPESILYGMLWSGRYSETHWDARDVRAMHLGIGSLAQSGNDKNSEGVGVGVQANVAPILEATVSTDTVNRTYPEAGAYTTHRNGSFVALQDIEEGHEIFLSLEATTHSADEYGDDGGVGLDVDGHPNPAAPTKPWRIQEQQRRRWKQETSQGNEHTQNETSPDPSMSSWVVSKTNEILREWKRLCPGGNEETRPTEPPQSTSASTPTKFCAELWNFIYHDQTAAMDPAVRAVLPKTIEEAEQLIRRENFTVGHQELVDQSPVRSQSWLRKQGYCLDRIEGRPSLIPNTGYGGYLTDSPRRRGMVVAPIPLLHIHRQHLDMMVVDRHDPDLVRWRGKQLLLNHVFGDPSSSLLLLPYGPGIPYINHSPHPNVALRWSRNMPQPTWLNKTPKELLRNHNDESGLMMELVALRDLRPGEELLLDYGKDWQEQWESHVQGYEPATPHTSQYYREAAYYRHMDVLPPYTTEGQLPNGEHALPSHVMTVCWMDLDRIEPIPNRRTKENDLQMFKYTPYQSRRKTNDSNGQSMRSNHTMFDVLSSSSTSSSRYFIDEATLCYIESRRTSPYQKPGRTSSTYSVRARRVVPTSSNGNDNAGINTFHDGKTKSSRSKEKDSSTLQYEYVVVTNLPREAIAVVDRPYTTNQYMKNTFRHEIQLPDLLVPPQWKDLKQTPSSHSSTRRRMQSKAKTSPAESGTDNKDKDSDNDSHSEDCGLFMAPSSIPNAGLGMFSAVNISHGARLFHPDLVVQAEDIDVNHRLRKWHYGKMNEPDTPWLIEHYFWAAQNTLGQLEAADVQSVVPGLGMLANSHTGLVNSILMRPYQDGTGLRRQLDPGVGSMTTYHGLYFVASQDIEAGSELFVKYGDDWFEEREDLKHVPLSYHFDGADSMLEDFMVITTGQSVDEDGNVDRNSNGNGSATNNSTFQEDLWDLVKDLVISQTVSGLTAESAIRFLNALPENFEDVERVANSGTAKNSIPGGVKSPEWLRQNGRCLDNIRPAESTINRAGYGAFATRSVKKGRIVTTTPLVHMLREQLEVYGSRDIDDENAKTWFEGQQLLLNYCYGHSHSSLLLFPYAPVVNYINHNRHEPNCKIQWSNVTGHDTSYLKMSPQELVKQHETPGLVMEFVATRDIGIGEEITIDYGKQFDRIWTAYSTRNWKAPTSKENRNYVPASQLNAYAEPIKTNQEQRDYPYSENLATFCYVGPLDETQRPYRSRWSQTTFQWQYSGNLYQKMENARPCEILAREDTDIDSFPSVNPDNPEFYVAHVKYGRSVEWVVTYMPRGAIDFFDKRYTSDMFMRSSFRFPIGLPDEMVPNAWRDLEPNKEAAADMEEEEEAEEAEETGDDHDDNDGDDDDDNVNVDQEGGDEKVEEQSIAGQGPNEIQDQTPGTDNQITGGSDTSGSISVDGTESTENNGNDKDNDKDSGINKNKDDADASALVDNNLVVDGAEETTGETAEFCEERDSTDSDPDSDSDKRVDSVE